jgi:hypothetical protein
VKRKQCFLAAKFAKNFVSLGLNSCPKKQCLRFMPL